MTLRERIEAINERKQPQTEIRINGTAVAQQPLRVDVVLDIEQASNNARVLYTERPAAAEEGASIAIWGGYDGFSTQIFSGEIEGPEWGYPAPEAQLAAIDVLSRTRAPWGGDEKTYTDDLDGDIIINILESYGIMQHNIESSDWTLGTIQDVVWRVGEPGWRWIEEIDKFAGYRTYVGPDGVVYRRRFSGAPGTSAAWSYEKGVNMFNVRRMRTRRGIINKVVVTGLSYEGLSVEGTATASNSFVPSPPGFTTLEEQSDLVEDSDLAEEIAERMVGDYNRRPEYLEFDTEFNPMLRPGMTIRVDHDDLEASAVLVSVLSVRHSWGSSFATTSITTSGGTLSGYNANAPFAEFALTLFQEAEEVAGVTTSVVVVRGVFTGFDPDGTEEALTYAWSISPTGGSATAITALTGQSVIWTLDEDVTSITVTLIVTDPDGLTDTAVQTLEINDDTLYREDLFSAENATIAASLDGQMTWNEESTPSGNADALSPISGPSYQAWMTSTGHVYLSFDLLATAPIDAGTPHGAVAATAGWINELDDTRLWVAFSDGAVFLGTVDIAGQSVSWAQTGTIPEGPVIEIRESYGTAFGELRATAGQGCYLSQTSGATWIELATGDTARRMAAGWGRNFYSFLNDSEPLREEAGLTITLPVLVPAVTHIRALTVGWRRPYLYAVDDQARLLAGEITDSGVTLAHVSDAPAGVNHMIRSGNEGADSRDIIYMAADDGILKWFGGTDTPFYVKETATVVDMIAYGNLHGPIEVLQADLLIPGLGKIWHYDGASWTAYGAGTLPNVQYTHCVSDPTNPQRWMIWHADLDDPAAYDAAGTLYLTGTTDSPIWETTDGGATWTEILLAAAALPRVMSFWAEYDHNTSGRRHIVLARRSTVAFPSPPATVYLYRGTGASLSEVLVLAAEANQEVGGIAVGPDGDTVMAITRSNENDGIVYVDAGGTVHDTTTDDGLFFRSGVDILVQSPAPILNGRTFVTYDHTTTPTLRVAADYRTTALLERSSITAEGWLACSRSAAWLSDGQDLLTIQDLLGGAADTVAFTISGSGDYLDHVRADHQARRYVAARILNTINGVTGKDVLVVDTETGQDRRIAGPTAPATTELAAWVDVIAREVTL